MRSEPCILHIDLDAFFAAVEQRDKPSLRGKPVIVGGLGPRGVVAAASYEARRFGVRSAMRMVEARTRCPNAAFLAGRFAVYRQTSEAVLGTLRTRSPLVEPVSLDEAYVDLTAGEYDDLSVPAIQQLSRILKQTVHEVTGGLTASVGAGTSKLVAKIGSDLDKPDGLVVVEPGTERELLAPMPVTRIPGVGPATQERLRRIGVTTVGQLDRIGIGELVTTLGTAHGHGLASLAHGDDDRAVISERESKSISVEDTFDHDIADPVMLGLIVGRLATRVCERLQQAQLSGKTVTVKVRLFDFSTYTRSATLAGPTDDARVITGLARRLAGEVDTVGGVRLLGVGVSGLADWVQQDLFAATADPATTNLAHDQTDSASLDNANSNDGKDGPDTGSPDTANPDDERVGDEPDGPTEGAKRWVAGADVLHADHGHGWVWGAGLGRVTVRFETADTPPGPVRTFRANDPDLSPGSPS